MDISRLYVNVRIGRLTLPALVDSGASCGILFRSSLFHELSHEGGVRLTPICGSLGVANGETAEVVGKCQPRIYIGGSTWKGLGLMVKKLPYPAIIGMDCLHEMNAQLDFGQRKLFIGGEEIENVPEQIDLFNIASIQPIGCKEVDTDDIPECEIPIKSDGEIIMLHPKMSAKEKLYFSNFLDSWKDRFAQCPGISNTTPMKLWTDPSMPPIKQRCFPLSPAMQKCAAEEVDRLLAAGLIVPSTSPWSSPAFLLQKKGGDWRLTIDYREVNKITRKNAYPLPRISETLDRLKDSTFVSNLDLISGYHQIRMAAESQELTAFSIHGKGHYEYTVMPFGLSTAPAIFQSTMEQLLAPVLGKHTHVYLDDIIIASDSFENHIKHLEEVFLLLSGAGFRLNWAKCRFMQEYTEFLGMIVGQGEIRASPRKTETITNFPRPKSVRQLRGFLSLLSWMRRFIPNLAEKSAPLTEMLKKGARMVWTVERNAAFEELKKVLIEPPVLKAPDFDYPFEIHCDSSDVALGAVLLQNIDNEYRVIAYASRVLTAQERNYTTTEKECLAVIFSVEKWRAYIEGQRTIVKTDHASLLWLQNINNPTGRLARWVTRLAPFDLKIVHTKGKEHVVPDCLSRAISEEEEEIKDIASIQISHLPDFSESKDPWYIEMKNKIIKHPEKFPAFKIVHDTLYKAVQSPETKKISLKQVVPTEERIPLMVEFHDSITSSHLGIQKTYHKLCQNFYWPKMLTDIKNFIRSCHTCQQYKSPNDLVAGEMAVKEISELKPFEIVTMDLIGPLPLSHRRRQFILVLVDSATKFVIAEPLGKANSTNCVAILEKFLVLQFGPPKILVTDNGSQLVSKVMKRFCAKYNIRLNTIPYYYPSANMTERYNRTIKTCLAIWAKEDHQTWDVHLPFVVYALRTSVNDSTGFSPAKLVYGRELTQPCSPDPILLNGEKVPFNADSYLRQLLEDLKLIYKRAKLCINRSKNIQAKVYNLRHRFVEFEVGTLVWRRNFDQSSGVDRTTAKLYPKYVGPFQISAKLSKTQYQLSDLKGRDQGRWHVSHLKLLVGELEEK